MDDKKSLTGLFFGSFNPIHTGHLMIANYMAEFTGIREVWFVISPHNPLKEKSTLLAGHHRLAMANIAVEDDPRFRATNVEFHLPEPSYTIDTLRFLREKYPEKKFVIVAGQDNLPRLDEWKEYETLLEENEFYIYPRIDAGKSWFDDHPHIHFTGSPVLEISSSFIRQSIREKKDVRHFLPAKVWQYIREMHFYEE
jgi:nicotinate-nucleotide adenylyltransferase